MFTLLLVELGRFFSYLNGSGHVFTLILVKLSGFYPCMDGSGWCLHSCL